MQIDSCPISYYSGPRTICGGHAVVAKTFGEGKKERANSIFSMLIYVTIGFGILLTIIGLLILRPVSSLLGAEGAILEDSVTYGRILLLALTPFMLQNAFQSLFVTAEKPGLVLGVSVVAGVTNIILDALFVEVFKWGLVGAAAATGISQLIGGILSEKLIH